MTMLGLVMLARVTGAALRLGPISSAAEGVPTVAALSHVERAGRVRLIFEVTPELPFGL